MRWSSGIYHGLWDAPVDKFCPWRSTYDRSNVWADLCINPKLAFSGLPGSLVLLISISSATFFADISSFYRTGRLQALKASSQIGSANHRYRHFHHSFKRAMIIWGASPRVFPDLLSTTTIKIGGAILALNRSLFLS